MSADLKKILSVVENYMQAKVPDGTSDRRRKFLTSTEETADVFAFTNPVTIGIELLMKLLECYPDYLDQVEPANELEGLCADELYKKLHIIKMEYEYIEVDEIDEDCQGDESAGGDNLIDDNGKLLKNKLKDRTFLPVAEKTQILQKVSKYWGKKSLPWIQRHGGSKLLHANYKARWEKHVRNGGTKFEKFRAIDSAVWEKFTEARQALRSVHGFDLKTWAIQAARVFPESSFNFRATRSWIDGFKLKHKITSRKINKIVKRSKLTAPTDYDLDIAKFREDGYQLVQRFGAENVINWDQSGCQYEVVTTRTLTHRGEPWTVCSARSPRNRATHSYTIQYSISASGNVLDQVYICLQESTGRLGPIVEESLPTCPNVLLTCSKSGKLTTSLIEYFLDKQLLPYIHNTHSQHGLVLDHWGGQLNMASYTSRFGVNGVPSCEILAVPKNCTSTCQPLDTVVYRQVKYFLRRLTEHAQLHDDETTEEPIHSRRNVILIHSVIHFQLSAEIFKPMIRYAWFKAGLLQNKESFLNVRQACFTLESPKCELKSCQKASFVRCARCRFHVCFECFFWEYHSPMSGCVDKMTVPNSNENSQDSIGSMEEE